MPYLRLYCPELPMKQKKLIAKELTNATLRSFKVTKDYRNNCMLQFVPIQPEDVAVNGKLLSDNGEPDYHLEVSHRALTEGQKQAFAQEVTALLAKLLNLKQQSWLARLLRITDPPLFRISILFREHSDENFAVGGRLLSEWAPREATVEKYSQNGHGEMFASAAESGI
jgi:phenylpyruvate tautomerase PptA (4-oxalocrotonate tautomerase family)